MRAMPSTAVKAHNRSAMAQYLYGHSHVTKQELGRDIRVVLELGQAPASGKRTAPRTAPTPTPRPTPQEPPKPSAADTPPWESPSPPAASGRDKLDELLENGKQLDGFQIK